MKKKQEFWPNGRLRRERPHKDDSRHGFSRYWNVGGTLRMEAGMQKGQTHGATRNWDEEGSLFCIDLLMKGCRIEIPPGILIPLKPTR